MCTISSCLIVKNELNNLPLLVDDLLQFSDEVVLVDTGSTDGTAEWILNQARQNTKIISRQFEWVFDFAAARNYSFHWASMDWIFWCDADDRISPELIDSILDLKTNLSHAPFNAVLMDYQFSDGLNVPRRRLLKRSSNPHWIGKCHECVDVDDLYDYSLMGKGKILHRRIHPHSDRNLRIFIRSILNGDKLSTRDLYYYSNELRDNNYLQKSAEIVLPILHDLWEVDAWNALALQVRSYYESIDDYVTLRSILLDYNSRGRLRADIMFILGVCHWSCGYHDQAVKAWHDALDTSFDGLEAYAEDPLRSKFYPAAYLYEYYKSESNHDMMSEMVRRMTEMAENPEYSMYNLKEEIHKIVC